MHSHTPLWFLGRQRAFNPQLTSEHAGTQLPCEHFWSNWQSKSDSHWGLASTIRKKWHSACISGKSLSKIFYHFHMCHHIQLKFPQDIYMPHSWLRILCLWPHTAETLSKDWSHDKGSDKIHSYRSIGVDNPCLLYIQVLLLQLLKRQAHAFKY